MEYALLALVVFGLVVAAVVWRQRQEDDEMAPQVPKGKRWKEEKITPVALGPRSKVRERVARGPALSQAVLLAVEMSRADGEVDDSEVHAIRAFILKQVTDADDAFADKVIKDGFATEPTPEAVENAIDTIRAISSEEQRRMMIQLLVAVAQADGIVHDDEVAFMEKVGGKMGLTKEAVADLIRM